jgi:hypothetical protein
VRAGEVLAAGLGWEIVVLHGGWRKVQASDAAALELWAVAQRVETSTKTHKHTHTTHTNTL